MADKESKQTANVPGKFYVDTECTDCQLCVETAGDIFKANEADGYAYVGKQPQTDDEIELVKEAMENCPVESIGDDGDA